MRGNESGDTQVCFTPEMLDRAGVNRVALLPESTALLAASQPDTCLKLPELVPHAKVEFDNSEQLLDISIPQAMLISNARGYVDPRYWDNGVNAATLQYTSNFLSQPQSRWSAKRRLCRFDRRHQYGPVAISASGQYIQQ